MEDGDKIIFKRSDEIWTYKAFDFGRSKDAIILIPDLKQRPDDAGYACSRFVVMDMGEKGTVLGEAPLDREAGGIDRLTLEKGFNYYMTLGEFSDKHPGGTNLLNQV